MSYMTLIARSSGHSLPFKKVKQLSFFVTTVSAEHSKVLRGLRIIEECTNTTDKDMKNEQSRIGGMLLDPTSLRQFRFKSAPRVVNFDLRHTIVKFKNLF